MPKVRKPRLRNFVFTLNNYKDADIKYLKHYECNYLVYGKEIGESGTPHLQGYVELSKQRSFKSVAKEMKWHIEARRGTQAQAIKYCKKDGDITERGLPRLQGKRNDIVDLMDSVRKDVKEIDCFEDHPNAMFKYWKAAARYRHLVESQDKSFEKCLVTVIYGEPGVGKSKAARWLDPNLYEVPNNDCKWFDGYAGEETILLDDYSGQCDYRYFLKLLDGYKFNVPVKGGFVWKRWKHVIITTNILPQYWYGVLDYTPIERRISEIQKLHEKVGA
ncbi:MAG: putative viral replication protein [Circoviridae sp.]|nr:MAG: putative viral replication protein [Circoviridae sp.]